jgi:hypothetical protein
MRIVFLYCSECEIRNIYIAANPLPLTIAFAAAVPLHGNGFLVVGGRTNRGIDGEDRDLLQTIYRNHPEEDKWSLLDTKMKQEDDCMVATMVDGAMFRQ